MNNRHLIQWTLANALGLGIGFLAYLQTGFLYDFGLKWNLHWQTEIIPQMNAFIKGILTVPTMLAVAGLFLGVAQAWVLRGKPIKDKQWILATMVGFILLSLVILPLDYAGIMGNIPGPVEPIIVTVGGCSLAGAVQYYLLSRSTIQAHRWLLLWVAGLVLSIIPTALMFIFLQRVLGLTISWPVEIFLNGVMCGGVAALISGKTLFKVLSDSGNRN